jgi:hypothetical protein
MCLSPDFPHPACGPEPLGRTPKPKRSHRAGPIRPRSPAIASTHQMVPCQCHKVFVARAAPSTSAASFVQPISA